LKRLLELSVVLLLTSASLFAGVGVWTSNWPVGSAVAVVVDPVGTLYAGQPNQLGGTPMNRSLDSGTSWQALSLLASPNAAGPAGIVYANSIAYGADGEFVGTLLKSIDGGMSWLALIQNLETNYSLTLDPFQPSTLFRVDTTTTLNHPPPLFGMLSRSGDGGATWTEIDEGIDLSASYISALAPDPRTQGAFYLATTASLPFSPPLVHPSSFYRTTDSGSAWTLITSEIHGIVMTLAVDPFSPSTLYAAVVVNFYTGGATGTFKSVDGGSTFQQINSFQVNAIAMDPVRQGHIYLGTYSDGVQVSSDGGASWASMSTGLPYAATVYALAIDQHGEFLHAATGGPSGVYDYQLSTSTCQTDPQTLCLNGGRFAVTADFQTTPEGPSARATAVPLTPDTGYFWFFDPANIEIVSKVLDGCSTNGHYWFFASGLTNVGVQINVTDTLTGASKPYSNDVGTPFQPIQDTAAFPCP
jgi:photosystem II stability/assembly factor-like uncharacterized protein